MCDQAGSAGLKCLIGKGDIANLLEMNRPAVLRLKDEAHGDYYAVLTALDGETATFVLGDETRTVDSGEIAQRWSGDYLLLWRVPPGYEGALRQGSRGRAVAWLNRQLALAQGRPAPAGENRIYDDKVKRAGERISGRSRHGARRDRGPQDDPASVQCKSRQPGPGPPGRQERKGDQVGMSYILEALKKLEQKREQEEPPRLFLFSRGSQT